MKLDINIAGDKALVKELKFKAFENSRAMQDAVKKGAFLVEKDAKYFCPVDTGRLRASITTNFSGSGQQRATVKNPVGTTQPKDGVHEPVPAGKEFISDVGTNVEYAPHIEFGTKRGIQGVSFLYTALMANQEKINTLIKKAIIEVNEK